MEKNDKRLEAFGRLLDIMDELREKCPWDRKQSMESLRHLTIEETYELSEAIIEGNLNEVKGELGDLMLHMVFYSKIASEKEAFDISDVLNGICEKLIHRHPHIYADLKVKDENEVKANWEKLKLKEGRKSVLQGVPKSLPAMVKAMRVQEKASGIGFDWEKPEQVLEKVHEELDELKQELEIDSEKAMDEMGDLFFSLINYSRALGINPEDALEKTNKKFISRFGFLEKETQKKGLKLKDMSLSEMDEYWEKAKQSEQ